MLHTNGLESSTLPKPRLSLLICDLVFSDLIGQSKSKKMLILVILIIIDCKGICAIIFRGSKLRKESTTRHLPSTPIWSNSVYFYQPLYSQLRYFNCKRSSFSLPRRSGYCCPWRAEGYAPGLTKVRPVAVERVGWTSNSIGPWWVRNKRSGCWCVGDLAWSRRY